MGRQRPIFIVICLLLAGCRQEEPEPQAGQDVNAEAGSDVPAGHQQGLRTQGDAQRAQDADAVQKQEQMETGRSATTKAPNAASPQEQSVPGTEPLTRPCETNRTGGRPLKTGRMPEPARVNGSAPLWMVRPLPGSSKGLRPTKSDDDVPVCWRVEIGFAECEWGGVAFSPDGKWLVTGGSAMTVKVWSAGDWREARTLGHPDWVNSVAFSADARWLATGSDSGKAEVWSVGDWREMGTLEHSDDVNSVAFSPDGKWVATGSDDDTAKVWSMGDWQEMGVLEHLDDVNSVAFSPDGKWLATGSDDRTAKVWSVGDWQEMGTLKPSGLVFSVAFSPDWKWLVTGGSARAAKVWSLGDWREAGTLGHSDWVKSVAFSPDGKWVATGSGDDTGKVWSVGDWREMGTLEHSDDVYSVAFSPDGKWVATGSDDHTVKVWRFGFPDTFQIRESQIDWCAGQAQAPPFPEVSLQLLTKGEVSTGQTLKAEATVSNEKGKGDLFRVLAAVDAPEVKLWHGRRLFFGHVEKGKKLTRILELPTEPDWCDVDLKFTLRFFEHNDIPPPAVSAEVQIAAQPRPRLSYSFPPRESYSKWVTIRIKVDHSDGTWDLSDLQVKLQVLGLAGGAREEAQTIPALKAGDTKYLDFDLAKWQPDPQQTSRLRVECMEAKGVTPLPWEATLEDRPALAMICSVRDPQPGNEDGVLQKGEPAQCLVRIENVGKTCTGAIRFRVTDLPKVRGLHTYGEIERVLGPLDLQASHALSFEVQPTHAFQGKELTFKVSAEEDIYLTSTERVMRLEVGESMGREVTTMPPRPMVVRSDGTNVYAGASLGASYLDTLPKGKVVTVNGATTDFYRLAWEDDRQAWVPRDGLSVYKPGGPPPPIAPPWVSIAEPTARLVPDQIIPVRLTAGAPNGLAKLRVFVGDGLKPQVQQPLVGEEQEWRGQVSLARGRNQIRVVVVDQRQQEARKTLHVRYNPQLGDFYEKAYAVVIGIDDYLDPQVPDLANAENDARAVERMLRDQFLFTEVRSLYGKAATRNNMEGMLFDWLANKPDRRDAALVYFACHGLTFDSVGYLVPYDGSDDKKERTRNIGMRRLRDELAKGCRAKDMMFVVTACFGGLLAERSVVVEPHGEPGTAWLKGRKARVVLTAGGPRETVTDAGAGKYSLFTDSFLNTLQAVDVYTTGRQIYGCVSEDVVKRAAKLGKKQKPMFERWTWHDDPCTGDFVFIRQ